MSLDALRAAQIYSQVAKAAGEGAGAAPVADAGKPNFAEMVKAAVSDSSAALKAGETAAAQVAVGEASLVDVVTAISAAEVSLETAIAVRNRVIEAYQEIMRMPI